MTSRLRTICPHCHAIVPARTTCPCRLPGREAYTRPSYKRNRAARYDMVGGLCECGCGTPLKGHLHPQGKPWECDHHVEARRFRDPDEANAIENLRCYVVSHHHAKTAAQG